MATKIAVEFALTGRGVNLDDLEVLLGLSASKTWRMGDRIQGSQLSYDHDGWVLSTGYNELNPSSGVDLPRLIREIFQQLQPKTPEILEACRRLSLEAELTCIMYIDNCDRPELHLDRDIITWLGELNAELDADIFLVR